MAREDRGYVQGMTGADTERDGGEREVRGMTWVERGFSRGQ